MKVYCDRLAEVTVNVAGFFQCPKCGGTCTRYVGTSPYKVNWYDCQTCLRGWEVVPDEIETAREAEEFLSG